MFVHRVAGEAEFKGLKRLGKQILLLDIEQTSIVGIL